MAPADAMIPNLPIPPRNYGQAHWLRLLESVPVGGSEMIRTGSSRNALLNAAKRGGWMITTRKVAGGIRFWVIARPQ